jgi:hypothetical protein
MGNNITIMPDEVLTTVFRGYLPKDKNFIHDEVLPKISVGSKDGQVINTGTTSQEFLKVYHDIIIGRSKSPEINVQLTKADAWHTEKHSLKIMVTKDDGLKFSNTDWRAGMRDAEIMYTKMLRSAVLVGKEYALANALFSATNITNNTTLSGANQWSDFVNSDPIGDVRTAKQSVRSNSHMRANVAIMGIEVFEIIQDHPQIKKTNGVLPDGTVPVRSLTEAEVAKAFGVEKLIVGDVQYEQAIKGATSSLAEVWGKGVLIAYVNQDPQPQEFQRSLGYSFVLDDAEVDTFPNDDPKYSSFVRVEEEYDDVILDESAAYYIAAAVA